MARWWWTWHYQQFWIPVQFMFTTICLWPKCCFENSGTKSYTPIAFDERVTFWLKRAGSLPLRACLLHCMRVRLRNGYAQAYVHIMQHRHMHKAVTGCVEAKKLLSRRKQSNYTIIQTWPTSVISFRQIKIFSPSQKPLQQVMVPHRIKLHSFFFVQKNPISCKMKLFLKWWSYVIDQ